MNGRSGWKSVWVLTIGALMLAGCKRGAEAPAAAVEAAAAPTNRVDIPAAVRQNLGITFAKVESRAVARTLRVPGRFELLPTAHREYRAHAPGRVELLVERYEKVEPGAALYRLDSPRWREVQRELTDAQAQVTLAGAAVASIGPFMNAHEKHHTEIERVVELWTKRVADLERLQAAGGARGDDVLAARAALASARTDFAETLEKEAELSARRTDTAAQLEAATARMGILLDAAASLSGRTREELEASEGGKALWQRLHAIEVRAVSAGVVDDVLATSGAYVDQNAEVLATVQPERVCFKADGLQSDLGKLADGLAARVVAPAGGSLGAAQSVPGVLTLAPTADSERRTIGLVVMPAGELPAWVRAGVSGFVEVEVMGKGGEGLAIPLACVARDGTASLIFRRDPKDANKAIRIEADLGVDDGRWVAIKSGVAEGDEIVLDGVYQLMVATSGSIAKGGHFHSDGTFHEGKD